MKVGPAYEEPAVALEAEWIDFNDPALITKSHGIKERGWWHALQDPVLVDLVTDIRAENLSLAAAAERIRSAQALRGVALGNLMPQTQILEASFSYNRQSANAYPFGEFNQQVDEDVFNSVFREDYDEYVLGGFIQWEIDLWGRYRRAFQVASASAESAEYEYHDRDVSLVAAVANAYIRYREMQERIALAEKNADLQQQALRIARARVSSGTTTALDENEAIANLARTLSLVPGLEARLREENNRLCLLLGRPVVDLSDRLGEGVIPSVPLQVAVGIPNDLLRRRPDIRATERQLARQSALIGVAAAEYFPALVLQGSMRLESEDADDLFASESRAGEIWPRLQWKVLNYGRIRNTVRAQQARYEELLLEYRHAVLRANAEAENALYAFLQSQRRHQTLARGVKALDRSSELAAKQYEAGAVTFGRLVLLQANQVTQQDLATQARADIVRAFVRIYKTLGGAW